MKKSVIHLNGREKGMVRRLARHSGTAAARRRYDVLLVLGRGLPMTLVAEALDVQLTGTLVLRSSCGDKIRTHNRWVPGSNPLQHQGQRKGSARSACCT